MPSSRKGWTRHQLLIAFSLYYRIPFGQFHSRNVEIIKYAESIGRTPSALAMKLSNIASLDSSFVSTGRKGLKSASKADKNMWDEMQSNWNDFAAAIDDAVENIDYTGRDKTTETKARVGQKAFHNAVFSSYSGRCCITGLSMPRLLYASHIIPWSKDSANRLNPQNGLLLSMLYDKAFDIGLITINEDMTIRVSQKEPTNDPYFNQAIRSCNGKSITLPTKFHPRDDFLTYHRDVIFESYLDEKIINVAAPMIENGGNIK